MTPYRTALITDSTCDIPDELLHRYDIAYLPCYIMFGSDSHRDRAESSAIDFYRRLVTDSNHPTTAQPTPGDFVAAYIEAQAKGAEEVLVIPVSSKMSGTIESARQAARMVDIPVYYHDSRGPTMSVGWQVLAAARARESGSDAAGMIDAADKARQKMVQWVAMDTLEYLHKGGRIGAATNLIGSLLHIKPLVRINHEKGIVETGGRARTRKRAIETLYQSFFQQLDPSGKLHIAVLHGDALADARALMQRIRAEYDPAELLLMITSPVLGVHTGPGALALCGYSDR